MMIIGCDFHSRFQQIAMLETETGEITERRLEHQNGEAQAFYAALGRPVRVGMEATGYARWFERMLAEQGHELWIGDAAKIRASVVRKQKTDVRDARHILDLLLGNRFPRIYVSPPEERDLWQLLRHRDRLVHWQTSIRNQLHGLAMGEGLCRKKKLWSARGRQELEALRLGPWAARRRKELLQMLDGLAPAIAEWDQAVKREAAGRPAAVRLMQQAGVGPVTSLALALLVGPVERFQRSRQLVSYVGLNPRENSSGGKQRLGAISKQGNSMVRWLLLQAAQTASRTDEGLRRDYQRLVFRRGRAVAKVAIARKLAVRLYWMLRNASESQAADSHAG
jgi:transposase